MLLCVSTCLFNHGVIVHHIPHGIYPSILWCMGILGSFLFGDYYGKSEHFFALGIFANVHELWKLPISHPT